jgi:hypothetical protein
MSSLPLIVIAVTDYVPDEIAAMKAQGITPILITEADVRKAYINPDILPGVSMPTAAILRSPRLQHEDYQQIYECLKRRNIVLVNTPDMVRMASEFVLHYPIIEQATPRSIIRPVNTSPVELYAAIHEQGLKFPLFVKTELKSLKTGSIIQKDDLRSIEAVLQNLHTQLSGFKHVIVREMVQLQTLPDHPDTTLEYRAFVLHNHLVLVQDGTQGRPCPPLLETGGDLFYKEWIKKLGQMDFSNFYIMDIAMLADEKTFVIIEIKDGQYTKIRDADSFGPGESGT